MHVITRNLLARGLTVVCLLVPTLLQAAACELPPLHTDDRPVSGQGPTKVHASIIVADLLGVDDINQQIDIDMIVRMEWTDPRLDGLDGCRFPLTSVWAPRATLFNSSNLRRTRVNAAAAVEVGPDGRVTYANRFTGLVSSYHTLRQFPFDSHEFLLEFGAIEKPASEMVFVPVVEDTWIGDRLNIEGWSVKGISIRSEPTIHRQVDAKVSVLKLIISAERNAEYYLYRVLLLLVFVVAMSWSIFWIPPSRFEFQIGLGATSMLTAIAFNLALASQLPTLGYLTTLDKMLIWSILLVFLSIVQALITGRMVLNDREEQALRLDRISRFLFPLALFLGWLIFYLAA